MSTVGEPVSSAGWHKNWSNTALALLILLAVAIRLSAYGDLRLSVATADTSKFIRSSSLPLLSLEYWTSNRPPVPALLYKLFLDKETYSLTAISEPAVSGTRQPEVQPGFSSLILAQKAFSIAAWTILAITMGTSMRHPFPRIMGPALVLAFAFSPPLVEWDSVLMSESLSFSLFALLLALTLLLARRIARNELRKKPAAIAPWSAWVSIFALWVFTRDANAYALPVTTALLIAALPALRTRYRTLRRALLIAIGITLALFWIYSATLQRSDRWMNPFFNNLIYRVFPYPDRVTFFEDHGMPISESLLALRESRGNERRFYTHHEFMRWVRTAGIKTYMRFIARHPVWALGSFFQDLEFLFSENRQPYFRSTPKASAPRLLPLGDLLHAKSSTVVAVDLLLLMILLCIARRNRNPHSIADAWVGAWTTCIALIVLFVSYHGDSLGMIRHALAGVLPLRLALWILTILIIDNVLMRSPLSSASVQGEG